MKTVKKEIEKIRNEMNQDQYYLHCQYIMGILAVKIKIIGEQLVLRNKRDVIPEKVEKLNNKISPIQDDYIEKYCYIAAA